MNHPGHNQPGAEQGVLHFLLGLPRLPLIWLIGLYQKTLSPDHSWLKVLFPHGYCKFTPSCSEYGKQVLQKRGLIIGLPRLIWRVLRCNPFSRGGDDPVT